MTAKLYSFTDHPDHEALLGAWTRKWIANAMSTQGMTDSDRAVTRGAILGMYAAAGLPPPKQIVFVPSPFVLRFAGGFAAAIWDKVCPAIREATSIATHDATIAATRAATHTATIAATRAATYAATHDATRAATYAATAEATEDWFRCDRDLIIAWARAQTDGASWLVLAKSAVNMWQGGNQWSAADSYIAFFRHVAKLPLDYSRWSHWETASMHSGPRIMAPDEHDGRLYLRAPTGTAVSHQEHETVVLPAGDYEIARVEEYDHFAEEARQVAD